MPAVLDGSRPNKPLTDSCENALQLNRPIEQFHRNLHNTWISLGTL